MSFDAELPKGLRDADFETRELENIGNIAASLRKRGICCHGWRQIGTPFNNVPIGMALCKECGLLATEDQLDEERYDRLGY